MNMERRGFLKLVVGGVAAAAAVRTFPFRVFSFPKEIEWPAMFGGDPGDLSKTVGPLSSPAITLEAMRNVLAQMKRRLGTVTQDTIYVHPLELKRWKSLGYIREVALTGTAEGLPSDMRGSYTMNDVRLVITPDINTALIKRKLIF